jgi:hypothetical protein
MRQAAVGSAPRVPARLVARSGEAASALLVQGVPGAPVSEEPEMVALAEARRAVPAVQLVWVGPVWVGPVCDPYSMARRSCDRNCR